MTDIETEIAIIGAGPAGGSLALALAQAGFDTILVDARDPAAAPREDTRNFAVVTGSWRLLSAIGIADRIAGQTQPLHGLEAVDGGTHWFGAPSVLFGDEDLMHRSEGETLGHMIQAPVLQSALDEAIAAEPRIRVMAPALFKTCEPSPGFVNVQLEDGSQIKAKLLVGADGVNSPVRNAAGITVEGRDYGKSVFAANVTLSRPHDGIARQLFTPEGPFATLPLPGDRANLAWYMKRGAPEALAKLPPEEVEAELDHRFSGFAGEMKIDGPMGSYPLILQIAEHMVADRVALVGDAARRINPLAGQGLNQGFRDIAALHEVLVESDRAGLDIGAAQSLGRYETARRFDANSASLALDAIDRLFSNDSMLTKPVRTLGLLAASALSPMRHRLAALASASSPDLPPLMQSQSDLSPL
ncbi:FAD-dependent monooxygenase [Henriciella marina]|uniref:FAD-dependent monooxygenase n=1 Tax=Henriciella marina TaxID=453851 RepID=UPI00036FCDC2|nr:FAD-dependent monooxygenase [Henriciella marina]